MNDSEDLLELSYNDFVIILEALIDKLESFMER